LYKPINERLVQFMVDRCYLALSFEDADVCNWYLASLTLLNNDYSMPSVLELTKTNTKVPKPEQW